MRWDQGGAVRIVVAGAGAIGQEHIKRVLEEPEARLVGIVDREPGVEEQAASLGVEWTADLESMLERVKPDGVVIALPNQLHCSAGLTAIRAGIATLIEKPVCDTVEEALRLAEAAEENGVPVLVGHHRRHSPLTRKAKQIVESGALGRITVVNAMCWLSKPSEYFEGKGAWRRQAGGGVVMINLVHVIDDLRNLCGDVASVLASASSATRGFPVEDTAGIVLGFRSGAIGTVSISDSAAAPWSWELTAGENPAYSQTDQFCYVVAGTEGSLSIPRLEIWHHGRGGNWWSPIHREPRSAEPDSQSRNADPLTNQMRHFCDVAKGAAKPLLDVRGALKTLQTTLAVKQSAVSGAAVYLS